MAQIALQLTSDEDAPARARQALRELTPSLAEDDRWRAELILTELVTNAVLHGAGGPVDLALECGRMGLRGRVSDQGRGIERRRERAPVNREGGRGLLLVDRLSDRWGTSEGASRVWFEIGRHA